MKRTRKGAGRLLCALLLLILFVAAVGQQDDRWVSLSHLVLGLLPQILPLQASLTHFLNFSHRTLLSFLFFAARRAARRRRRRRRRRGNAMSALSPAHHSSTDLMPDAH